MKIFRVVITFLPISIPQWNIGQNSIFNKTIKTNKQTKQKTFLTKKVTNIEFFYGFFLALTVGIDYSSKYIVFRPY